MSGVSIHKFAAGDRFPREASLNIIIEALRDYTGKDIAVSDLLEYIPDKPSKAKKWLSIVEYWVVVQSNW